MVQLYYVILFLNSIVTHMMYSDMILGGRSSFSPSFNMIAVVNSSRLTLYDSKSMETLQVFSCVDKIDKFSFSPDSEYVMCCIFSRNTVQVFSVVDNEWRCRINEGVASIVNAEWAPDSRSIVTVSDFGIQMSIWSLTDSSSRIVLNPKQALCEEQSILTEYGRYLGDSKHPADTFGFSADGSMLAVVHRLESSDFIGVYMTSPWGELSKFKCKSNDVAAVMWSCTGQNIITVESSLHYSIKIYDLKGGLINEFCAYERALGVRNVARQHHGVIPTNGGYIAVGSYDDQVRLISSRTWKCVHVLPLTHPDKMTGLVGNTLSFYSEQYTDNLASDVVTTSVFDTSTDGGIASTLLQLSQSSKAKFSTTGIKELPQKLLTPKQKATMPDIPPLRGVSGISWSDSCHFLVSRSDTYPQCMWIWNAVDVTLSKLIVALDCITSSQWQPSSVSSSREGELLAYCVGTPRVYLVSMQRGEPPMCIDLPAKYNFAVTSVCWGDAKTLLLRGRESFVALNLDSGVLSC
jgi:hypothetical protein